MILRFEDVNYIYGIGSGYEKHALKNISFSVEEGEFIGIVGHTGSGKSTLTQLMNGLEKPTTGKIYFKGQDLSENKISGKELRSKVGLVFQYPEYQLFETTVIKDVEFGPKNLGLKNLEVEKRSFDAIKMVGLSDDYLDVSPHVLSGGQKRRVAIAGILAMEPEVLILDEPTAGLDPRGREEILGLLAKLHREKHITILLVSHSMDDVARYADRVMVLNEGQIVLDGKPSKIFQHEKELSAIGLGIPQSTKVMHHLGRCVDGIRTDAITPEEAADEIAGWIKKLG